MDKCNLQNIEHRKLKMSNMNPINKPGLIYDRKKIELVNLTSVASGWEIIHKIQCFKTKEKDYLLRFQIENA